MKSRTSVQRKTLTLLLAAAVALSATAGLAGVAGAATTTDLTVSIADDDNTVAPGDTTTVEIAVASADGGVGAASYGIELSDPSVAEITDAEITGSPVQPAIKKGGSVADVRYFQANTTDSGEVVILTVTLEATASGSTSLDVVEHSAFDNLVVFDEGGAGYELDTIGNATLTVNSPPAANAGENQTVDEGATATLDASGSNDPDGDSLSYQWSQAGDGPSASLSDATAEQPTVTAPEVSEETTLDFQLEVTDSAGASDTDAVSVTVQPSEPEAADFQVSNLQAPGSATQGDAIDVSADVENTGGQAATKPVEFRVDVDGDGFDADDDVVLSTDVQLDAGASTTVTFEDVDTGALPPSTYTHGVVTPDDSETAQITIDAPPEANFQVSNLQAPGSATQGDTIDVSADVENTGGQTATKPVEFRVDVDGDGSITDDDAILNESVELAPGESTTVDFDVPTGALDPGTYTHGVATPNDTATAQITIEAAPSADDNETTVSLQPADQTSAVGGNTTYEVVVDSADGGVGAGEIAVDVDDPSVATITDATVLNGVAYDENTVTDSSAQLEYFGTDTTDNGSVTIAEVTVAGASDGTANLSIGSASGNSDVLLFDEDGAPYDVTGTNGASLEVLPVEFLVDDTSAPEKAAVGSTATVTATISSDGALESTQSVELLFDVDGDGDLESVETKDATIGPNGQTQVSFDVAVPADASFGDRAYAVETAADTADGTVEITPPAVSEEQDLPGDPDGDGLYEDVNGDGSANTGDAQSLFANRDSGVVENNAGAFDFNDDGVINVGDAQALFDEVTG